MFGNRIESTKDTKTLIDINQKYFNVGTTVMQKYYNRYNYYSQLLEIQTLMVDSMVSKKTTETIKSINENLKKLLGYKSIITNKKEKEIKRLVRLTPDNVKWEEYLISKKRKVSQISSKRKFNRRKRRRVNYNECSSKEIETDKEEIEEKEIGIEEKQIGIEENDIGFEENERETDENEIQNIYG